MFYVPSRRRTVTEPRRAAFPVALCLMVALWKPLPDEGVAAVVVVVVVAAPLRLARGVMVVAAKDGRATVNRRRAGLRFARRCRLLAPLLTVLRRPSDPTGTLPCKGSLLLSSCGAGARARCTLSRSSAYVRACIGSPCPPLAPLPPRPTSWPLECASPSSPPPNPSMAVVVNKQSEHARQCLSVNNNNNNNVNL